MTRFIILFVLFAGLSTLEGLVYAQEIKEEGAQVLLHGVVIDASTGKVIPDAHYVINSTYGGATTLEGKFSMYISHGDTVVFSFMGYSDFTFSLSDTLRGNSFVAGIFLESDTLAIGEVIVMPRMNDLRTEFRNMVINESGEMQNARNNLNIATYQGLNNSATLGDPANNYQLLKNKQITAAYEKGGIPSDQMVGLNLINLLPVAAYLLSNGLPEKPKAPEPYVSKRELDMMLERYRLMLKNEAADTMVYKE